MRLAYFAVLILAVAAVALPQQKSKTAPPVAAPTLADESASIKVDVDLVNVLFSVRDKRGGLVGNLEKGDFKLFEDGKEQEIKYFTRESNLPLTIGLLIDVSRSQENLIDVERRAGEQFLTSMLGKKDMAFLISFGSDAELLQDYTNSPKLLRAGLNQLRVNSDVQGIHPGPVPTASHPKGTILYDAVYLAASEKLKGEVGRKVIVIITDGMDFGSRYKIGEAIEAAQKSDAIIYSIYYVDQRQYGGMFGGGGTDSYIKRMSEETGGHMYRVDRKHPLEDTFKEIQQEMRSQYSAGYSPSNGVKDGGFRRLEIRPNQKDQKVQARRGYYATKQ